MARVFFLVDVSIPRTAATTPKFKAKHKTKRWGVSRCPWGRGVITGTAPHALSTHLPIPVPCHQPPALLPINNLDFPKASPTARWILPLPRGLTSRGQPEFGDMSLPEGCSHWERNSPVGLTLQPLPPEKGSLGAWMSEERQGERG